MCGDPSVGRGIHKHVQQAHHISYDDYKLCFNSGVVIVDELEQSGAIARGAKRVMIHVLVRKFAVDM